MYTRLKCRKEREREVGEIKTTLSMRRGDGRGRRDPPVQQWSSLVVWSAGSRRQLVTRRVPINSLLVVFTLCIRLEENVTLLTVSNSSVFSLLLDFESSACVFRVTPHSQQYLPNFTSSANYLTRVSTIRREANRRSEVLDIGRSTGRICCRTRRVFTSI